MKKLIVLFLFCASCASTTPPPKSAGFIREFGSKGYVFTENGYLKEAP